MTDEFTPKKQPTGNYPIGWCRTPTHTRWQKGQSGNPKGRRPRSSNIAECVERLLRKTHLVQINGRMKRNNYAETVATAYLQLGLRGSLGALRDITRIQQARTERNSKEGWTIIAAAPVFEEEENRYLQTFEENQQLRDRIQQLEERLNRE